MTKTAQKTRRLKGAATRIIDHAVHDAVERVARRHGRVIDERERRARKRYPTAERHLPVPHVLDAVVDLREVGGASHIDAVVILGIALRFHQSFFATGRAAVEVGVLRRLAVERLDDGLALHRHLVNAARTVVDDLLQVLHPRGRIPLVAGVGAADGVALDELGPHVGVLDVAGEAVVAVALELAVPALERHPQLELDLRRDRALHAAERRQLRRGDIRRAGRRDAAGEGERARGHLHGRGDERVGQAQLHEVRAGHRTRRALIVGPRRRRNANRDGYQGRTDRNAGITRHDRSPS